MEFADINPVDDLLDVGLEADLFQLEPAEVRLWTGRGETTIEAEDFAAARPDPFQADERDLLEDLREHHLDDLAVHLPATMTAYRPVRLDRHGVVVAAVHEAGIRLVRLEFPYAADGPCCISRALRLNHSDH